MPSQFAFAFPSSNAVGDMFARAPSSPAGAAKRQDRSNVASRTASVNNPYMKGAKGKSSGGRALDAKTSNEAQSRARQSKLHLSAPSTPVEAAKKLRNKALRLLTTREHSKEELMRKLAQAKARVAHRDAEAHDREAQRRAKDDIETLVDELAAQGWQSDERYAEAMIRRLAGQASRRYIADKLAHAGIKKEVSQLALDALDQDDREVAHALWLRRFGETPKDEKERQRHIRFLLSRGFHLSDAFRIVPNSSDRRDRPIE